MKILATSDWSHTGFGRVMMELFPRLAKNKEIDITIVGWVYTNNTFEYDRVKKMGIRLESTYYWNLRDRYGAIKVREVAKKFKPDILFSLGDVWMIDWIGADIFRDCREKLGWALYTPIDRDYLSQPWLSILKQPDCLVLYSKFAENVVKYHLPYLPVEVIYHGVNNDIFKPLSKEEKISIRKAGGLDLDSFIVGQVCRNQSRKLVARTFKLFRAWNCCGFWDNREYCRDTVFRCDKCNKFEQIDDKKKSILYLHMTDGTGIDPDDGLGISWNIYELSARFKLKHRVFLTPGITVKRGLNDQSLNLIFNCFDVHILTTKREGFGLPILETMACGVPNVVTDYSSCSELLKGGKSLGIKVQTFVNEPDSEAESAICDIEDGVLQLEKIFRNIELRENISKSGVEFASGMSWENTIPKWERVFENLLGA